MKNNCIILIVVVLKKYNENMKTFKKEVLAHNIELNIVHIDQYDQVLFTELDKAIVSICEGKSDSTYVEVKKRMRNFLKGKDEKKVYGSISEFFIHLYLKTQKYKQDCLFFNLEENSVKKGFDGVYTKNNEIYIMESKSGKHASKEISHVAKVKESYRDLEKYLEGKSSKGKNPWINAFSHANQISVKTKKSVRDKIKEIQRNFDNNVFSQISEFNIIPCSTIYLDGNWDGKWSNDLILNKSKLASLNGKKIRIISITNIDSSKFTNYLDF